MTEKSKQLISRFGGEIQATSSGFNTTGMPDGYKPGNISSNSDIFAVPSPENPLSSWPIAKYREAVSFFLRKGIPESLAKSYGAALIDASLATGKDVLEFMSITDSGDHIFNMEGLGRINILRSKTSQIGKRSANSTENTLVLRTVLI